MSGLKTNDFLHPQNVELKMKPEKLLVLVAAHEKHFKSAVRIKFVGQAQPGTFKAGFQM